jgi:hypothetical protein
MRILFDQGTPAPLIPFLEGHTVTQAKELGWDRLVNGDLLRAAEETGFEVLLTTDKNIAAQQNLKARVIAIVVLGNSQWRIVRRYVRKIVPPWAPRHRAAMPKWTYRSSKSADLIHRPALRYRITPAIPSERSASLKRRRAPLNARSARGRSSATYQISVTWPVWVSLLAL